jgi:hypothetical protein
MIRRPAELRNAIYEHLLEPDLSYPSNAMTVAWYANIVAYITYLLRLSPFPIPFLGPARRRSTPMYRHLNIMTLVSKQFRGEYMDVFSRLATFNFTLDASDTTHVRPFAISSRTLSRMRKCALKILATPGIVGAFDPREATGDWLLRDKVFDAMAEMKCLQDMTLEICAAGNQLWNPLWLWHFTSQAFKESPILAFKRIDFRLEGWTLREPNHLLRNANGEWEWHCSEGHCVQVDGSGQQPVREFCARLYVECRVCDPLPDGEIEE